MAREVRLAAVSTGPPGKKKKLFLSQTPMSHISERTPLVRKQLDEDEATSSYVPQLDRDQAHNEHRAIQQALDPNASAFNTTFIDQTVEEEDEEGAAPHESHVSIQEPPLRADRFVMSASFSFFRVIRSNPDLIVFLVFGLVSLSPR